MEWEVHGTALRQLAQYWHSILEGGYVQQLRGVGTDTFVLRMHTKNGNIEWAIRLPGVITQTLRKWTPEEKQPGFVNATKTGLANARIIGVRQHGMDRVLVLECEEGSLVIELFGKGNLVWVTSNGTIGAVLHAKEWRTRTMKRNHPYVFPPGPPDWEALPATGDNTPFEGTWGAWWVTRMGVPREWVEYVCERVRVEKDAPWTMDAATWDLVRHTLKELVASLVPQFEIIKSEKKNVVLVLRVDDTVKEGLDQEALFSRLDAILVETTPEAAPLSTTDQARKALEVNHARQVAMMKAWETEAASLQVSGEWVYSHFEMVEELLEAVRRGRALNVSDAHALFELKKIVGEVTKVDVAAGTIELEVEKE
ncbi:MAG: NFACT family protein [Candidatus Diapherotrites archaeon]|nr:NFACT family protein [Candidatus Diapherotrites archaeon]MDZ4256508.1 NFACT family protein [archaeon]